MEKATDSDNIVSQTDADDRLEEKILKDFEDNNSIISKNESMESDKEASETSAGDKPDILESLFQTDTESIGEEEEEPEFIQRQSISLPQEEDIFHILEDVPNLENIPEDAPIEVVPIETPVNKIAHQTEGSGRFVSLLAGVETNDSLESISPRSEDYQEIGEPKDEAEEQDISEPADILSQEEETKESIVMDDGLTAFLQLHATTVSHEEQEKDMPALAREEEAKDFQKYISKYITDLINKVVATSDRLSPEKFLQQNLDKHKVLLELVAKLQNLYYEQSQCTFLNRKVVHHFRRKKSFRSIMEDSPKSVMREKQKLEESKKHLDQVLSKEHTLVQHSEKLQQDLRQEYEKLKQEAESQVDMFESKVKNHLYRDKAPKLNADIDRLLLRMRKHRQEVSAVRLSLLLKQHTAAKLGEMIKKMEDLGNGLHVNNFTTLQAECHALDKTIEERNVELNKLYRRSHNALHTLAHYKENQQIIYSSMNIQRNILINFMKEEFALKGHLLSLKLQRNRIHKKMRELSVQSGLLDKPDLLYDYDNVAKLSEEKAQIVETLRNTLLENQTKLDQLLECSNVKNFKVHS